MITFKNRTIIFDVNYCKQCGMCLSACSSKALIHSINSIGLLSIIWNEEKCTFCCKCVQSCPADIKSKLSNIQDSKKIFLAHAIDQKKRHTSSSGGAGRILFETAVIKGLVSNGYSLVKKENYPWVAGETFNINSNFSNMPNSIYHPALMLEKFNRDLIKDSLVVIGLPCQLQAIDKVFDKEKVLIKIALYCKQQKHLGLLKYLVKDEILDKNITDYEVSPVEWRGNGWPGKVKVCEKLNFWEKVAAVPYGKKLWRVPGCKLCSNPYGEKVDITLSDPWGIEKEGDGKTLVIVWSKLGEKLVENSKEKLSFTQLPLSIASRAFSSSDEYLKADLVPYYQKNKKITNRIKIIGFLEVLQVSVLEIFLKNIKAPNLLLKVIARLPELSKILHKF